MTRRNDVLFHLRMPAALNEEIEAIAARYGVSKTELMRRFLKLGLVSIALQEHPTDALIVREGDTEKEVMLI